MVFVKALVLSQSLSGKKKEKEDDMDNRSGVGGFAVGLILGAVVGLAVGFLYAPRPGQETREMLREKAKEVREKGAEFVGRVQEVADDAGKKVRDKLERA